MLNNISNQQLGVKKYSLVRWTNPIDEKEKNQVFKVMTDPDAAIFRGLQFGIPATVKLIRVDGTWFNGIVWDVCLA